MSGKVQYSIIFDFDVPEELVAQEITGADNWSLKAIKEGNIFIEDKENEAQQEEKLVKQIKSSSDYRYSPLKVLMLDFNNKRNKSSANSSESLKAKFMGYGVVRLFKEHDKESEEIEVESDDTTVAIVAVPSYFSATDLLVFLGNQVTMNVSHFRLIKSENPNRFMVLMKFRNNEAARIFQERFNGRKFSSMESEACHVIFVKSVIFKPLSSKNSQAGIPYLLEDPFTLQVRKSHQGNGGLDSSIVKELPTCPVCLERMDSDASGLLTISCQHTFHCNCLSRWRDDTCPVCRYSNITTNTLINRSISGIEDSCSICGGQQNLWICLICGNIGCGRYNSKHAIQHYESTNHCFAMDIGTQRVWDYAADNYVHRLIQNESDGKLVELPANSTTGSPTSEEKGKNRDYAFEYTNVLLSQLESQREYYESRLAESAAEHNNAIDGSVDRITFNNTVKQVEQLKEAYTDKFDRITTFQNELKSQLDSAREKVKKLTQMKSLAQTFEKKWKEEQAISQSLSENMNKLKVENQSMKTENEDLQAQVTDLMFYLESQDKFKDASEDVRNGTVVLKERRKRSSRK